MSAAPGYPTCCLSEFCGRVLCDGCSSREHLVAFYRRQPAGELERYEERQAALRADKAAARGIFAPPHQDTN